MATLKTINNKIAKLQAQAEAIAKKESSAVLGTIRSLMEEHGLTSNDIAKHFRTQAASRKSAAATNAATAGVSKYVDPKSGATWSGRGRAPAWIANAKNRDKYLANVDNKLSGDRDKMPKAGNYVRGPQTPKYRHPKSGETWSGRGRAPAWLATVKDRTKFLIEAPEIASAKPEPVTAKKTKRKVAIKKVATKKVTAKTAAVRKTSITKSAKKAASKTSSVAQKTAPAARKAAAKKAASKRGPAKKVALKKATPVKVPTAVVEPNVTSDSPPVVKTA